MTSDVQSAPAFERVLAVRGVGGHRQYRIPALAVTARGTVLAAYDGRPNLDDLPNTIDLLLRRSVDHGRTWEDQIVVRTGEGLDGYGDPSLVVDAETGRIFLFHAAGTHAGFFESSTGTVPVDDVQHVDLSWSDDDGLTWRHRRLTEMLKTGAGDRRIAGIFAAAGQGIQIHSGAHAGRLLQQFVALVDGTIEAASAHSDDHGETWTLGEWVPRALDGTGPNENKVVSLADGSLLLHTRATPVRHAARSDDGGQSWSRLEPIDDLPDPSDNGSLARFDGLPTVTGLASTSTDHTLMVTNNRDPQLRRNTVLSISHDDGATWSVQAVICAGSSAYSTATRLANGDIGVLYERDGYREIVFTALAPSTLSDVPAPAEVGPVVFDMVLRSITPGRPEQWQSVGEEHVIAADSDGEWDVQTWKEIGQGYAGAQILGTREAQTLNYGEPCRSLRAGDILAFTGRAVNRSGGRLSRVRLIGSQDGEFGQDELADGESALFFTPCYVVTADDVAAGGAALDFTVDAIAPDGTRVETRTVRFRVDVSNGTVAPQS